MLDWLAPVNADPVISAGKWLYRLGMRTYAGWRADRTMRLGAGLAYYALFTIVPFLALSAVLVEQLFDRADMQSYIAEQLEALAISDGEVLAEPIVDAISRRSTQSSLGLVGLGSLLFAASLLFSALADAVNTIWGVPVGSGMWNSLRRRLVAFTMVLGSIVVLVAELAVAAISGLAQAVMPGETPVLDDLAELLTHTSSWAALAGALTLLNRFGGPVRIGWPVALGAGLTTSIALVLGTWSIGVYLEAYGGASVTGAFSALLALLTWVYVEAQILLVGVQLTKALAYDAEHVSPVGGRPVGSA